MASASTSRLPRIFCELGLQNLRTPASSRNICGLLTWRTTGANRQQNIPSDFFRRVHSNPVASFPPRPLPKILQFVKTGIWRATHKDASSSSSSSWTRQRPPRRPSPIRDFIDSLPSGLIVWGVLAVNGVVIVMWKYAVDQYKSTRDASQWVWMNNNFTSSIRNLREGRIWTLLTCCFSHEDFSHLFFNGFTYFFMAPPAIYALGNTGFLALYLGSGIFSSLASIAWKNIQGTGHIGSHGASGAIFSIMSFFATAAPNSTFLIFGLLPCPAWLFVAGAFVYDGYNAVFDKRSTVDAAGHIGGIGAGMLYYLVWRRRIL